MDSHARGDSYRPRNYSGRSSMSRRTSDREEPPPSRCVGVFGLAYSTRDRDLYEFFSRYGRVNEAQIVFDTKSGRSRGFGFISFNDVRSAIEAKERAHGLEIQGNPIRVEYSFTSGPHAPTPGVYLGRPTRSPPRRSRPYEERGGGGYRSSPPPFRGRSFERRPFPRRSRSRSPPRRLRSSRSRSPFSERRRHVADRTNPPSSHCLGVFGMSPRTKERDLIDIFSRYGVVDNVNLVVDNQTGRSRCFAFVYFASEKEAKEAKERANGTEVDGYEIRCDFSVTNRAHSPTPGVYLGRPTRYRSPPMQYNHSRMNSRDRR